MDQFFRTLHVDLSASEVAQRASRLAAIEGEYEEREADAKEAAAEAKRKLKRMRFEILDLAETVRTGRERQPVECEERPDFAKGSIDIFRTDTGELIDSRPMSAHERQMGMDELAQSTRSGALTTRVEEET